MYKRIVDTQQILPAEAWNTVQSALFKIAKLTNSYFTIMKTFGL